MCACTNNEGLLATNEMRRKIPRARYALAQVISIMIVASPAPCSYRTHTIAGNENYRGNDLPAFPRSFYFAVNFTAPVSRHSRDPTRNRTRYNPPAAISAISKQFHFARERTKKYSG